MRDLALLPYWPQRCECVDVVKVRCWHCGCDLATHRNMLAFDAEPICPSCFMQRYENDPAIPDVLKDLFRQQIRRHYALAAASRN